ncbi:MAG: HDOD domain-containing protein [Gammaproteobacteria bacterium]|nr:HDOD domain-containing protein [Gammaproteobacteria bacterium]
MSPEQLIDSNIKLVSLPAIVAQVNQMANDPTVSAADIAHAIGRDTALTARLLKIVNSPFYRFPSKIDTLSMAVTVLGTRQLRDLVIAAAIIKRFQSKIDPAFNIEVFWCHSITTAIASRLLALQLSLPNSERYFVIGMLHDIGKMVMYLTLPNESINLIKALAKPDCDVKNIEHEIFGFTHDDLGAALMKAWHFPDSLILPVRGHVAIDGPEQYLQDAALLHLANNIANNIQAPISRDDDTVLNPKSIALLNITSETIEAVYEETYRHLDELLEIFYYDIAA